MNCPSCNGSLVPKNYKGIEVDACVNCGGTWLDFEELDQLEDTVFAKDELKATTIFATSPSARVCAKCGEPMKSFEYQDYEFGAGSLSEGAWFLVGQGRREESPGINETRARQFAVKVRVRRHLG